MLKQSLQQKLQQKMSPQQIQVIKLLEIPLVELEQRIKDELESNPTLEEVYDLPEDKAESNAESYEHSSDYISDNIPAYKLQTNNYSAEDEREASPLSSEESFQEFLNIQLSHCNLSEDDQLIGKIIIGNIDPDGYLRRNLKSIVDDIALMQGINCEIEDAQQVLNTIQTFDPPGVGSFSLRECLLLQLDRKEPTPETVLAIEIIDLYFEQFSKKHYARISKSLNCTEKELKEAISVILKLNPKPGGTFSSESKNTGIITPDFILEHNNEGKIILTLNQRNVPELTISPSYTAMLEEFTKNKHEQSKSELDATLYIRQKIDSAKWFIDAIKQRQRTLLLTMSAILEFQKEYFEEGDETKLKPMILKDIAEKTHFDISTISRVSSSKYVYTPTGMFPLKYFFSESMQTDSGDEVSTREIKSILNELLSNEDKNTPLTDEKLTEELKARGYHIARRTVAKYREQLKIPVARLRKEL